MRKPARILGPLFLPALLVPLSSLQAGGIKAPEWVRSYSVALTQQIAQKVPPYRSEKTSGPFMLNLWMDESGLVTRVQLADPSGKALPDGDLYAHVSSHLIVTQLTPPKEPLPMPIRLLLKPRWRPVQGNK